MYLTLDELLEIQKKILDLEHLPYKTAHSVQSDRDSKRLKERRRAEAQTEALAESTDSKQLDRTVSFQSEIPRRQSSRRTSDQQIPRHPTTDTISSQISHDEPVSGFWRFKFSWTSKSKGNVGFYSCDYVDLCPQNSTFINSFLRKLLPPSHHLRFSATEQQYRKFLQIQTEGLLC